MLESQIPENFVDQMNDIFVRNLVQDELFPKYESLFRVAE